MFIKWTNNSLLLIEHNLGSFACFTKPYIVSPWGPFLSLFLMHQYVISGRYILLIPPDTSSSFLPAWNVLSCPAWMPLLITSYMLIKSQHRYLLSQSAFPDTHTTPRMSEAPQPWALRVPHAHLYLTLIMFCDDLLCLPTILHYECSEVLDSLLLILLSSILGKRLGHIRYKYVFE